MTSNITSLSAKLEKREVPRLVTIKQFCTEFAWPSESAMRSYIYRAEELNMSTAFIRIGRRVLIDVNRFFEIITTQGNNNEQLFRKK